MSNAWLKSTCLPTRRLEMQGGLHKRGKRKMRFVLNCSSAQFLTLISCQPWSDESEALQYETLTPKTASKRFGTVLLKNKELRWIAVRKGGYHTSLFPETFILEEPGHSTLLSIFLTRLTVFSAPRGTRASRGIFFCSTTRDLVSPSSTQPNHSLFHSSFSSRS